MKQKAVVYVTRNSNGALQLLVFDHRDFPNAGTQVPAGTIEPGERPQDAAVRELAEESGLTNLRQPTFLGEQDEPALGCRRHYFHFEVTSAVPDRWDWTTNDFHHQADRDANRPLVFSFRWITLTEAVVLAGDQHRLLWRIMP